MHPFRGSTSASSEQGLLEVMRWVGRFFEEVSMTSMVKALCVLSNLVTQLSPLPQVAVNDSAIAIVSDDGYIGPPNDKP